MAFYTWMVIQWREEETTKAIYSKITNNLQSDRLAPSVFSARRDLFSFVVFQPWLFSAQNCYNNLIICDLDDRIEASERTNKKISLQSSALSSSTLPRNLYQCLLIFNQYALLACPRGTKGIFNIIIQCRRTAKKLCCARDLL